MLSRDGISGAGWWDDLGARRANGDSLIENEFVLGRRVETFCRIGLMIGFYVTTTTQRTIFLEDFYDPASHHRV